VKRFWLTLSTYADIVFNAKHWFCRIRWIDEQGKTREEDAECMRNGGESMRFDTKKAALSAGLLLAKKNASGGPYFITKGSNCVIDPQEVLSAPGDQAGPLNALWSRFEELGGWDSERDRWPEVQAICDEWTAMIAKVHQ
jgi:hypothetical protein